MLVAAAYREVDRAKIAAKESYKDFEYLYGITNKYLNAVNTTDSVTISPELFYKKYPNGNIKEAEKILQRYRHYINPNTNIIGRSNLYVIPGTKTSRNNGGKL